jgi:putative DNA primase/helicase
MSKVIDYASPDDGVELLRADKVDSIASDWHMEGWLPDGELVILGGDGGAGKTLIAMDWVATLSNSGTRYGVFSDGTEAQRGSALIWSCEDDWNRVLKPRLDAAGANYRNIFFVGDVVEFGSPRTFDFKRDLPGLVKRIEQIGDVKILVIDTVMDVVSGGGNNAKKVREDLLKLVEIAHRYQITVIGIAHLVKDSKKGDPVKNLAGSQAFSNLARHVLIAMKVNFPGCDESVPSVGVLTRAKSNLGMSGGGRLYEIHSMKVDAHDGRPIETAKLIWHRRELSASAADIRRWAESEKGEMAASPRNRAQEFLLRLLKEGPISANEAYDLAEEDGITPKVLRTASEKLRVVSTRKSDDRRRWNEWSLPERGRNFEPLINLDAADERQAGNSGQVGQAGQPEPTDDTSQKRQVRKAYETDDRNSVQEIFNDFMGRSAFQT